jgi:hypothetical protein
MDRKPLLWIAAVVVAIIAGWQLASAQGEKEKAAQKWEYKVVVIAGNQDREKSLADAGEAGWELVSATVSGNNYVPHFYFKRPK